MRDDEVGRPRRGEVSWARLIDVGVAHVDHLTDREDRHDRWLMTASDGSSLAVAERSTSTDRVSWLLRVYRPGPRPGGGTASMREWVFDWERRYDDVRAMLDDVAAIAG
jgi:hypothetical protein